MVTQEKLKKDAEELRQSLVDQVARGGGASLASWHGFFSVLNKIKDEKFVDTMLEGVVIGEQR